MKRRQAFSILWTPLCAFTLVGAFLLTGCGGGGGNNGNNSGNNGNNSGGCIPTTLASAEAGLNALVCGGQTVSLTNLSAIVSQFDQARQCDPTNKDAQLGYAISAAALAGAQFANVAGPAVPALRASGANAHVVSHAAHLAGIAQTLTLWRLPSLLSASGQPVLPTATDFLPTTALATHATANTTISIAQLQTAVAALDASLINVEQALAVVGTDPSYAYTLADPSKPCGSTATLKVGSAEIQLLGAAVSAVRTLTNIGLAYNADPGTFDFNAPLPSGAFSGGAIAVSAYIPPTPFGTLMPDGAARLQTAKQELNNTANAGIAAIEAVKTRSNAGYLLDPGTVVSTSQLNTVETQIRTYQAYLSSTPTIPLKINGQSVNARLNVSAFFDHPPADLKALLPTLPIQTDSAGNTFLVAIGYADTTFGGVFPDGIPVNGGTPSQKLVGSNGNYQTVSAGDVAQLAIGVTLSQ